MGERKMGYRSWVGRRIVLVPLAAAGALALVPAMTSAWLSWDGIDPIITSKSHEISVKVEWPSTYTCGLDGNIDVKVKLPEGFGAVTKVTESEGDFPCADGTRTIATVTRVHRGGGDDADIKVAVKGEGKFPVKVSVNFDGKVTVHDGVSNKPVKFEVGGE